MGLYVQSDEREIVKGGRERHEARCICIFRVEGGREG